MRISTVGGGTISPGTGTGSAILKASRLTVSNNVNLVIDINGSVAGTSHDQLAIGQTPVDNPSTSVVLNNANLQIRDSVSLPMGTVIRIIDNDQTDAISGTFAGLPAGLDLTDIVASAAGPVTVTLTLVNPGAGTLSTGTAGAATSTYDSVTGVWTVSGATADVNSLLATLAFTPVVDFNASFTIIASVSDGVTTFSGAKSMTETNAPAFSEFVDPNPNPGNQFGHSVVPLSTGNVVITSPFDDAGGTDAGAVYLFNRATGALISRLIGSSGNDNVGFAGVTALSNGNLVVRSPNWDSGAVANAGAVTFGSGISGVTGMVNFANSSLGQAANALLQSLVVDTVNGNFFARFRNEGSGKVRVGSIETGFAHLVRKITVFTGDSTEPEDSRKNGQGTVDFGSLAGGISAAQIFTIRNSGVDPLTDLAVSATGVNGGNYAVNTSGMESSLAPGVTATFTVTFAPTVTTSGLLPALVEIASNAVDETPFVIPVTGMFYSPASDMDGDGLDDASEVKLSQFGFDPHVNQAELVAALFGNLGGAQANLNAVGYFTDAQVRELHINTPLIQRNPGSGEFTLTLGLEKSTTLQPKSFQPFPFSAPDTSVNDQGKIEFQFTVPDNAAFFRLQTE